ncbi:MAG: hypothetical protein WKF84_29045 [Pyrinomonadaceae bacterium]
MLASAVSICGVSAAIAPAEPSRVIAAKLSYVTSLVLLAAIPMIVLQPGGQEILGIPNQLAAREARRHA